MEQRREIHPQKAIILAPDDKGLAPVFGVPAVRRLSLLLFQMGIPEILILGCVERLRPVLSDLTRPVIFHALADPASLAEVLAGLVQPDGPKILVLRANHVLDRDSLAGLLSAGGNHRGTYFLRGEGAECSEVYLSSPVQLVPIVQHLWSPSAHFAQPLFDARPVLGNAGLPSVLDGGPENAKIAEEGLMEALAFQTREQDGFLARHVDRRISRFLSGRISRTSLTPNQITLAGTAIGLAGAFFLALPGYGHHLIGALLFVVCIIVDGVDGEVARLKLQETLFGHRLDVVTDNVVHVAVFLGIARGLYLDSGDTLYLRMVWVLLGGFALCLLAVYQCILRRTPEELRGSVLAIRVLAMFSSRDFAYLILALALLDRLGWFLTGAAAGAYVFAVALWIMSFYEKKALIRKNL